MNKRRPTVQIQKTLEEFEQSGKSIRYFCLQRLIPERTFRYWRQQHQKPGVEAVKAAIQPEAPVRQPFVAPRSYAQLEQQLIDLAMRQLQPSTGQVRQYGYPQPPLIWP